MTSNPVVHVDGVEQPAPDDTTRIDEEMRIAALQFSDYTVTAGGITIKGGIYSSVQPGRYYVLPGTRLYWSHPGKLGMLANGQVPSGLPNPKALSFHTVIPQITTNQFVANQKVILMKGLEPPTQFSYLEDAVLIECFSGIPSLPALATWPNSITGFTSQDVTDFLDDTNWWYESRSGWSARYCHPVTSMPSAGEPGYGGAMATVTSFGAMLLCSNITNDEKKQVQDRMVLMGDDLEGFAVNYDANGGHGNGRYILWLVRQYVRGNPTTMFSASSFSENQQIYRDANNNIAWRFSTSGPQNATYEFCCTINRWVGAAVCAKLVPALGASSSDWVTYTIAYMTAHAAAPGSSSTAWYFCHNPTMANVFLNAGNRATIGF